MVFYIFFFDLIYFIEFIFDVEIIAEVGVLGDEFLGSEVVEVLFFVFFDGRSEENYIEIKNR